MSGLQRLLEGLPLPERYLLKGHGGSPPEELRSELSIPTLPPSHLLHQQQHDEGEDTDLDASDLETDDEEQELEAAVAELGARRQPGTSSTARNEKVPTAHVYPTPAAGHRNIPPDPFRPLVESEPALERDPVLPGLGRYTPPAGGLNPLMCTAGSAGYGGLGSGLGAGTTMGGTTMGGLSGGHLTAGGGSGLVEEMSAWQRTHQDHLRRQRLAATAPAGNAVGSYMSGGGGGGGRLDAVKQAADNIIEEKDQIIERQRATIRQLQSHDLSIKLQEAEYENASLKAQLAEALGAADKTHLERKLGETEYAMRQLEVAKEKDSASRITEFKALKQQLAEKDASVSTWREKSGELSRQVTELTAKVASLKRYLAAAPTAEDTAQAAAETDELRKERHKYKQNASYAEKRRRAAQDSLSQREELIEEMQRQAKGLQERHKKLEAEKAAVERQLQHARSSRGLEELEELREANARLQADHTNAKTLLSAAERKLSSASSRHQAALAALSTRLEQEESTVTALKADLGARDDNLKKVRHSLKKVQAAHQEALESLMAQAERLKQHESRGSEQAARLLRRLGAQLGAGLADLTALVDVCLQHSQGHDLNISALLGGKGGGAVGGVSGGDEAGSEDSLQALKHQLSRAKDLRRDIDRLREVISTKYAEEMGDNLTCATQ